MSAPAPEVRTPPPPIDPTARWKSLAVLAIVGVLAIFLVLEQTLFQDQGPHDRPAPSVVFRDRSGNAVSLASYRGKVVLMNFWATWCGPCQEEVPSLDRMAADMKREKPDLVVLAASVDDQGWKAIDPFVQQMGVSNFQVVLDDSNAASRFGTNKLPETWIIGRDGKIIRPPATLTGGHDRFEGAVEWDDPDVLAYLRTL